MLVEQGEGNYSWGTGRTYRGHSGKARALAEGIRILGEEGFRKAVAGRVSAYAVELAVADYRGKMRDGAVEMDEEEDISCAKKE